MIGLINIWDCSNTPHRYLPPARLHNDDNLDSADQEWVAAAIKWGITVMNHPEYIDYKFFGPLNKIVYTISYYNSEDGLNSLRARSDYVDFLTARSAYVKEKEFILQEKIITIHDDRMFESIEELLEVLQAS